MTTDHVEPAVPGGEYEREPDPSDSLRTFGAVVQALCEHTGLSRAQFGEIVRSRLHRFHERGVADLLVLLAETQPKKSIGVIAASKHTQFSLLGSIQKRAPRLKPQLYTSQSRGGQYRNLDLGRPGIVIVHRRSAKGLGFDTVVIPDTHEDAATDPTSAALRMSYYVMATRARRELHLDYEGQSEPPLHAQVNRGDPQRG